MLFFNPTPPENESAQVDEEKRHDRPDQTTTSLLRPRRQKDGIAEYSTRDQKKKCRQPKFFHGRVFYNPFDPFSRVDPQ